MYGYYTHIPAYLPDQGYRTYQPATIEQLNRLREFVATIVSTVNQLIDDVTDDNTDTTDIKNRLTKLESEFTDIQTALSKLNATDNDLQQQITKLSDRVKTAEDELAKMLEDGQITQVSWQMVPYGVRELVNGTKNDAFHDFVVKGDDTIKVGVAQSEDGHITEFHITEKGGANTPEKLVLDKVADGFGVALKLNDTVLSEYKLTSSDNGIAMVEGDGPTTDLKLGQKYTDEQKAQDDKINALEKMGFADGVKTSGDKTDAGSDATVNIALVRHDAEGNALADVSAPIEFKSSDGSVKLDSSTGSDHAVLDLTDQTVQDIGSVVKSVTAKVADKAGVAVDAKSYDAKTKQVEDIVTSVYVTTDANLAASVKDGAIELDGQPGVDAANKHSDDALAAEVKTLNNTIEVQVKRIDALETELKALQNDMAVYKEIADRSVVKATLAVTPNDDKISTTTELDLYSNDGKAVAQLPFKTRYFSPKNTIVTGIQQTGTETDVTLDVTGAPESS